MPASSCHIVIIGAGLGGLAAGVAVLQAGHRVSILERASALGEIGAGIQLPPNTTRILKRWGLLERLGSLADRPRISVLRSYRDGKVLSSIDLQQCSECSYGHPYLHVHRADYHAVLSEEFRRLGGTIATNSEVVGIDFVKTTVQVKGLPDVHADLIVGADGVKAVSRELLLGRRDPPSATGDMAYRCVVRDEDIAKHPELARLLDSAHIHSWIGPDQHVMAYKVREGDLLNVVIARTDDSPSSTLPPPTNLAPVEAQELSDAVQGWQPDLQRLLSLATGLGKGRLMRVDEMETWINPWANFVLLGDACHATLPYLAQGAAQAIEDGAVLGHLFEKMTHRDQLPDLLVIYESLRKSRTSRVVKASTLARRTLHLADGPRQKERDRQLEEEKPFNGSAHSWADPVMQEFLFGYDARREVDGAWEIYLSGRFPLTTGAWKMGRQVRVHKSEL